MDGWIWNQCCGFLLKIQTQQPSFRKATGNAICTNKKSQSRLKTAPFFKRFAVQVCSKNWGWKVSSLDNVIYNTEQKTEEMSCITCGRHFCKEGKGEFGFDQFLPPAAKPLSHIPFCPGGFPECQELILEGFWRGRHGSGDCTRRGQVGKSCRLDRVLTMELRFSFSEND